MNVSSLSKSLLSSSHSSLDVPEELRLSGAVAPSISGTAYPGETLTVSGGFGARQWTVDGVDVSGETGATYVVRVNDIGKEITCTVGVETVDPSVVCWHPNDEPGVSVVVLANTFAFNTGFVEATDGQTVEAWNDQGPGNNFSQATALLRPTREVAEQSGNDVIRFDGLTQRMTNINNDIGRNKSIIYLGIAVSDTNRTGGLASHCAVSISTNANAATARFGIYTRLGSSNIFDLLVRRLDADSLLQVSTPSLDGFNVVLGEGLYPTHNIRVNGVQMATGSSSSGSTSDTASVAVSIGSDGVNAMPGDIAGIIAATPSSAWTASQRSRIERYLGLLVGKDIPLV